MHAQEIAAVVEKLVSVGADLYAVTADGNTALHVAVKCGAAAALRALRRVQPAGSNDGVEQRNLLAYQDSDGCTPLHAAIISDCDADCCEEMLDVLLSFNSEHVQLALTKVDKQGRTVLHTAIEQHKIALLQRLLQASSKLGCVTTLVNTADIDDADCWHVARRQGVTELTELLATHTTTAAAATTVAATATAAGVGSNSAATTAGVSARASSTASAGDLDCANVHTAVSKAHTGCLKLLLARSPSAAAVANSSNQYPLHLVDHSKQHCDQLTAALLSACPSDELHSILNTADASGQTALQRTVRLQHADEPEGICHVCHKCMRALLAAGADTTVMNRFDNYADCETSAVDNMLNDAALQPPVSEAAVAESISTVQALLAAGCDLYTKLHRAVSSTNDRGKVRVLLACGADPSELDEGGLTAVHYAAAFSSYDDGVEEAEDDWLLADAVPVNVLNIQDLYDAAREEGDELVNYAGGDNGCTPLHFGACCSSSVQKLLQLGADPTVLDEQGRSALHKACEGRCAESVKLLLAAGADPHACSDETKAEGRW
jgi:ankyrin repeat protein